jgi:cytochrome c oxidase assembly factor CtaG
VRSQVRHVLPWLPGVAALAVAVVLLPPVATAARHDVLAEAIQFAVLAVVVPAMTVLGAPWRHRRPSREPRSTPGSQHQARLADRVAIARSRRAGAARGWLIMIVFTGVAVAWRLPPSVNALTEHPALEVAEAVTLIAAGCLLWLELADSPPLLPTVSKPQRAAMAAVPMWALWASAYIMAFSRGTWFSALAHAPGHGLSTVADQQIAAGLLFAIPGLCFVPVVYFSLITWLRDTADPDDELREVASAGSGAGPGGDLPAPRPPRGWRLPSA